MLRAVAIAAILCTAARAQPTVPSADITGQYIDADGECVRITAGDRELLAMPLGKPATREGRQHQSLLLAKQLRQAKSLH
jgi:hypothetical protein